MNFLLKIVEGPNKGAEIALVSGVAVTLGKGDDCDIVLADKTLPSAPISIEASDGGVTADGEPLEEFAVKTLGATSFAVGPADEQWGELKWPKKAEAETPEAKAEVREVADEKREAEAPSNVPDAESNDGNNPKRKRGGCCGCLVVLALLILALAGAAWLFRDRIKESGGLDRAYAIGKSWHLKLFGESDASGESALPKTVDLAVVASRYDLSVEEGDGPAKLVGNLKTRAERLRATAEAYDARPGVELDLSDDESFRMAAEDALFTLTEGALKVDSATNRFLSIVGVSRSPNDLGRILRALNADLPKLRGLDTAQVRYGIVPKHDVTEAAMEDAPAAVTGVLRRPSRKSATPALPVCGILTKPYPCLVMRDGTRVMEGASLGGNVILKIDADAVTVTNSTGRFVWKP